MSLLKEKAEDLKRHFADVKILPEGITPEAYEQKRMEEEVIPMLVASHRISISEISTVREKIKKAFSNVEVIEKDVFEFMKSYC